MTTMTELKTDATLVYNGTVNDLVALAEKYNVSTNALSYARANPNPNFASFGHQAFKTNSDQKEIRSKLYATIKGQMRKMGA